MTESQTTEYKESWRDEYLKWICGFANANGGKLIIGKNDKGKVVGIDNAKELLELIPNKVRDLLGVMVDVNLRKLAGKNFLEIVVKAYPNPISYRGEYYYRSGSTNQTLRSPALDRFLLSKRGRNWDDVPELGFGVKQCSADAVTLFKKKAAASERMDPAVLRDGREVILENLELVESRRLRRASCLLFSDKPERIISGSWIKVGFFVTDDDLRYQDEIHGNLFAQVEKTLEILQTKYLKAYISYDRIQRIEKFLFPTGALREALLNAVVHKDYSSGIPIQISVYDDKIVLWNTGHLPEGWTMQKFLGKHGSKPPNPLLANAFFRAGYIESWGRGIEKINRECREHGIKTPVYDFDGSGLMVTFHANPAHLPSGASVKKSVEMSGKMSGKIVALVQENPSITIPEIAQHLNRTERTIERLINKLKTDEVIRRIGPAKGGYWEVIQKKA